LLLAWCEAKDLCRSSSEEKAIALFIHNIFARGSLICKPLRDET
jgi:hypothetical protein